VTKPSATSTGDAVNRPEDAPSKASDGNADRAYDAALLARAAKGDQRAFREIVERHQRRAHAVAYGLVRNPEDAREVVQEAFIRVYKHVGEFAGQASFSTWLYRIVVNLAIDTLRKRAPGRAVELEDHTDLEGAPDELLPVRGAFDPQEALGRKRLLEAMQTALDKLPPYHRAVILLRELEGMSYEDMAQTLNVSKGTIMSRLFHARRKMQVMLRESLGEDAPTASDEGDEEGAAGLSTDAGKGIS
jgi:RNA polymerase sigma-70 factor, ECF subfamily